MKIGRTQVIEEQGFTHPILNVIESLGKLTGPHGTYKRVHFKQKSFPFKRLKGKTKVNQQSRKIYASKPFKATN